MKKAFALATTVLLLLPTMIVAAENLGSQGLLRPVITTVSVLGRGIAVSEDDSRNFKILKIGIARLRVSIEGEEQELAAGVLWLDDSRYLLKNVVIEEGHTAANVYLNSTKVGNIDVTLTEKGNTEIWVGILSINDDEYNVYILEGQRKFKDFELGEKVSDVCEEHPEKCRDIAKDIGNRFCDKLDDSSCREKIKEFCEAHPDDKRCVAVFRSYCEQNLQDARCRQELTEFCKDNPTDEKCLNLCEKFPRKCSEEIRERIKEKIRIRNATTTVETTEEPEEESNSI